jgi:outer membrane protein TolC
MTQKTRTLNVWALMLAMSGMAATVSAQTPQAPPATRAPQGPAAAPQTTQDRYIVGQAKPPEITGQSVLELSLTQAIERALDRNLDLKVQRFNPQLTDYSIQQTKAAYRGTLTQQTSYSDRTTLSAATTDGNTPSFATRTATSNTNFSQPTRFHGLNFSASANTSRSVTTQTTSLRPIGLTSTFGFNVTQPLLRYFKTDNARTTLQTQQITREINDITLATAIANTVASVKNAYWDLRSAIENIEIQRRAVALATTLVDQNRTKVEIGTMAQIDVIQAESQQAQAELSLVNAESTWRTAEMTFKRLIAGGTDDTCSRRRSTRPTRRQSRSSRWISPVRCRARSRSARISRQRASRSNRPPSTSNC